ncbi:MAG: type II toxin-antitoxin system MqsA family antitoxin [Schwartzia sp.]|nr:type II toxin-antitoxin system MqsA family antitoxin [Schwartzia sp. (in: firmicutes)]
MKCMKCGADAVKSTTTDVTDLGACLIIIRNVPCYRCTECAEIIYTGDTVRKLEEIVERAKSEINDISVIDYMRYAA